MISRRPSHIRPVITTVEKSLNGSNEPSGPPIPKAGPTFESMLAETETASSTERSRPVRAASIASTARADHEDPDVEKDERRHGPQCPLLDDAAVEPDGEDDLRVQRLVDLAPQQLPHEQVAYDLDRAGGRARGAADEHQADDRHQRERRPGVVVRDREAGGRHRRDRGEDSGPERVTRREDVLGPDLRHDDDRPDDEQRKVQPELLVAGRRARLAPHDRAVHEREVDPAEDHEERDHPLGRGGEPLDRVGLRREARGRNRRQGVRERVERRHLVVGLRRARARAGSRTGGR